MWPQHQAWVDDFLANCTRMNRSKNTIINYRQDLEKFVEWIESNTKKRLDKIGPEDLAYYLDYLKSGTTNYPAVKKWPVFLQRLVFWRKRGQEIGGPISTVNRRPLAVSSQKRMLSSINNFFVYLHQVYAHQSGQFQHNPVKSKIHSIRLKDVDMEATPLLAANHWQHIQSANLNIRDKLIVNLLYWGGLRLNELTQLRLVDFNENSKTISLRRKGGSIHVLKVRNGEYLFFLFNSFRRYLRPNWQYLFAKYPHRPYSTRTMYKIIKRILAQADVTSEITPHSFRKGCATSMYQETQDLLQVRNYLNHTDAKVTQTYIDIQ